MFEFVRIQYELGAITAEDVRSFAPAWITAEEAEQIVKGAIE